MGQLLNIKIDDISETGVNIYGLKNSFDREIPVKPEIIKALRDLPTDSEGHIFPISYSRLVAIWQAWTPNPKKTFKSTRHTFAVELYKKTKDIRLVQFALGHKNINNTLVYAALVDGNEKLKAALL